MSPKKIIIAVIVAVGLLVTAISFNSIIEFNKSGNTQVKQSGLLDFSLEFSALSVLSNRQLQRFTNRFPVVKMSLRRVP